MTKIWKTISFWTKLKATIGIFAAGSDVILLANNANPLWHGVVIISTILGLLLTAWIEDKDNDGIVDLFEDVKTPATKEEPQSPPQSSPTSEGDSTPPVA